MSKRRMNYRKTQAKIENQIKGLDKQSEKIKCLCPHRKDGQATLVRKKTNNPNESIWICYQCKKEVDFKRIDEDKLKEAIDIIDRTIDVIKFNCKENNENDIKLHDKLSKTQYRIRNMIERSYKVSLNESNRRENNRSRHSGQAARWN